MRSSGLTSSPRSPDTRQRRVQATPSSTRAWAQRPPFNSAPPQPLSVAVDLDQPLIADPEVMRDLVQHDVPDLAAQDLRVPSVQPFERPAVDRDLVR